MPATTLPALPTKKRTLADLVSVLPRFGRSVHLERDLALSQGATAPTDGYFLTTSALEALHGVLRAQSTPTDRALTLIGPYGAGKSAFVTFLARLVADPSFRKAVKLPATVPAVPKLLPVPVVGSRAALGPALLAALRTALESAPGAPVLPKALLTAEQKPSPRALANAYLAAAAAVAAAGHHTGLLLLVDEAGKFLEYAAAHPQAGDLFVLQELAEAAARAPKDAPLWVLTVLHQNAEAYAYRLGRTQQGEWAKVAQRFRQLPLFPSDVERMDLIGRALRHESALHLNGALKTQLAPVMDPRAHLLPSGLANDRFEALARAAYPLHPVTLLAVPALFRRAGQSHRSIFNFLEGQENGALGRFLRDQAYDPAAPAFFPLDSLFEYSRDVLLAHYTGPSARPWLEAVELVEQDLTKNPPVSPLAARALKCIALLNWLREPRLPASRMVLAAALGPETLVAIEELEHRSLVVFSRARGAFRLWEGGDVDIEAELTTARNALIGDVLLSVATDPVLFPLPRLVARRHAFRTGTVRPVSIEVLRPEQLMTRARQRPGDLAVLLCLAADPVTEQIALIDAQRLGQRNLLIAVAQETEALREAAQQLAAARVVADTVTALAGDRAGRRELALRRHEAEQLLRAEWGRLFGPVLGAEAGATPEASAATAIWYREGQPVKLPDARAFSQQLSVLADHTFYDTPVLRNELLNRRQLSSAGAGARATLVKAMLAHGERERLEITGYPPEFAMYASVLLATGLHHPVEANNQWAWRSPLDAPEDLANLRPAWRAVSRLVFEAREPVALTALYDHLRAAPYGISEGVLPVLVALFRRVHEGDTSLYREGNFLVEEKEADWELLLRRPDMFALGDSRVTGERRAVVERIAQATGVAPQLVPVVRRLLRMLANLPDYTRQTRHLPETALALRAAFEGARAPEFVLFQAAPQALGLRSWSAEAEPDPVQIETFFKRLNEVLATWEAAYPAARDSARDSLLRAFGMAPGPEGWTALHARLRGLQPVPPVLVPLVSRCTAPDPDADLERVLALVANRPPQLWRDVDLAAFPAHAAPLGAALQDATAPPARPTTTTAEKKQVKQLVMQLETLARPAQGPRPAPHVLRAAVMEWLDRLERDDRQDAE